MGQTDVVPIDHVGGGAAVLWLCEDPVVCLLRRRLRRTPGPSWESTWPTRSFSRLARGGAAGPGGGDDGREVALRWWQEPIFGG